ncbi:hypothetical protein PUN28_018000 [Cardiocondyla obscurior]|uniref:Uncharacterized protein n=1 Tax=Cardiocondyla obscurior TaxID=286306 RepID=A0AAW2EFC6_9HYME
MKYKIFFFYTCHYLRIIVIFPTQHIMLLKCCSIILFKILNFSIMYRWKNSHCFLNNSLQILHILHIVVFNWCRLHSFFAINF